MNLEKHGLRALFPGIFLLSFLFSLFSRLFCRVSGIFVFLAVGLLSASCGKSPTSSPSSSKSPSGSMVRSATAAAPGVARIEGESVETLLENYENSRGAKRLAAAEKLLRRLEAEEVFDEKVRLAPGTHPDSVDLIVCYWAGSYFYDNRRYDLGIDYTDRAARLSRLGRNLPQTADCEALLTLLHFRKADYVNALTHARNTLDLDRSLGDELRISTSLSNLAAISLAAKHLDQAAGYILEALKHSTKVGDRNRMAVQHGMASEIYHAMGDSRKSLRHARRALDLDTEQGNTDKIGIRLSQMASAQADLGDWHAAGRSLQRAMPLLKAAGNVHSLAICHNQMGEMLHNTGRSQEAVAHFEQAAEEFRKEGDLYNESRAQKGLYLSLKAIDLPRATEHLERLLQLKDSVYDKEMQQSISNYNAKYKNDEYAVRIEQSKAERMNLLLLSVAVVIILGLVIFFLLYLMRLHRHSLFMQKQLADLRENFFTNITHELRTPLTLILGLSREMSQSSQLCDELREKAHTIERQGDSLLTLINQLLDISKIKSAVGDPDWRNGNIVAHVAMIVESYREYAHSQNIDLRLVAREAVEMDFVPDYVNKVMNNLLSNAFKFTPQHGIVTITLRRENKRLHVEVADNGRGIAPESLPHIFDTFYQAADRACNLGTGIGLTLVKQIVDAVGGIISVESTLGKGSHFRLDLPIKNDIRLKASPDHGVNRPLLPHVAPPITPETEHPDKCRILVIEDNRDVADYIGSQFGGRYNLHYATDGNEGLRQALELVPDIIITDLMMPGIDGIEVCRRIRNNDIVSHIPLIMVTAKITEAERVKGLEAGADAYLAKPFNSDELRTRVEKLLESRQRLREKYARELTRPLAPMLSESSPSISAPSPSTSDIALADIADNPRTKAAARFLSKLTATFDRLLEQKLEIDVTLLASEMCMSNSQLYRKITALTGQTPTAHLHQLKINRAQTLLISDPGMNLSEVAERSGFKDYSNFVRVFKNICGVTPTEYKKHLTSSSS